MDWLLKRGQMLVARGMQSACIVQDMLGEGGQAEVYRARIGGVDYALKWYRPEYLAADPRLWDRLRVAINIGSPAEQYLWPFDIVSLPQAAAFGGYLMPIKPAEFISLVDLMYRKCEPSFRALCNVGFQLADAFLKLHACGLCYRDINFGNIFFNPDTGDIRIADTDNVDVNMKRGGIMGTWGFMAPEVGRREVEPNAGTDRFSLAILMFHIFMVGHPLKGQRESMLPFDSSDTDGTRRLCADDPLFVFDPDDASNRPVKGVHDAVLNFWPVYPQSLRVLFTRSFTVGLCDADARVMENEWRKEMCILRDSIFSCPKCGAENFFDIARVKRSSRLEPCWFCATSLDYPPRMRTGGPYGFSLVALSEGTQLFPHHVDCDTYNFSAARAQVMARPLGLKNISVAKWSARRRDGTTLEVLPGETLTLEDGARIYFGKTEADVKL
jgi:DNA-binding helix-hairpin-helix protein with protein kinase domain